MLRGDNMKDMLLLALRYIKVQRKHSIFIIISVMLSVALTMFSISVVFTYRETKRLACIEQYGSYHVLMTGLDKDKAELLSHNAAFSQAEIFKMNTFPDPSERQYIDENGINNFYSYDYLIVGVDNDIMSDFGSNNLDIIDVQQAFSSGSTELLPKMLLAEGHMPKDASQIAIPEECGYKVGDKVKLVKAIMTYDYYESYFIPIETKEKIYTVCGLLSTRETFAENIYVSDEDTFPFTGGFTCTYGIRARFADMNAHFLSTLLDICEKADIIIAQKEGMAYDRTTFGYAFNHELIDAEAAGKEARAKLIEISAALYVVIMLILAGGRMIIDCEFELTAEKKRKHMGLMMSIGADDHQLVAVTTFEGIILGLIAVPLGLILGYLIIIAVCMIVSSDSELMNSLCLDSIKPVISIWYLVIASITGIGWVFFSAYGTAVRIKKVNPVEAVNGYRKSKKLPFPKKPYKHRDDPKKFLGSITYSTMHMEKKRFVSCTASVTLSMFLFVMLSYSPVIYENYQNIALKEMHEYNDDFIIRGKMSGNDYYELKDIFSESGYFEEQGVFPLFIYFNTIKGTFKADGDNTEYRFKADAVGSEINNNLVSEYSLADKHIPIAVIYDRTLGFEDGSIFTAYPESFNSITADGMPEFEFMVVIPDEVPDHIQNEGFIRISMFDEIIFEYEQKLRESCPDYMAKIADREIYLRVSNADDYDKAKEYIQSVIPEGVTMRDLKSEISSPNYLFRLIRLMAAAVVIVFALIAVSNIFNITVSGISESRRSYGLLRAVGMTDRQLEKTAAVQTFLPIIYASVITLILTAAAVIIIAVITVGSPDIKQVMAFTEPHTALIRVIIASAAAFAVAALAAYFPLMRIEKSTVSDSVRFEA